MRRHTYENMMRTSSTPHSPALQQQPLSPAFIPALQQQPLSPAFSPAPQQQDPLSPTFLQQQQPPPQAVAGRERMHTVSTARMSTGTVQTNGSPLKPSMRSRASTGSVQLSASRKQGYENVVVLTANVPQYEHISSPSQSPVQPPLPWATSEPLSPSPPLPVQPPLPWATSEPLSPSPPLPDRNYLDSDMTAPPHDLTAPPPGAGEVREGRKVSTASLQQPPLHEVSATGNEYAIIHPKHLLKKHQEKEREEQEGGVAGGVTREPEGAELVPTLPLRAHQRMRSREDLLAEVRGEVLPQPPEGSRTAGSSMMLGRVKGDHTPSALPTSGGSNDPVAYSVVKLDPVSGRGEVSEETLSLPVSPQPYEVASPTPTPTSAGSTHFNPAPSSIDPHYEEIQGGSEVISGEPIMAVYRTEKL